MDEADHSAVDRDKKQIADAAILRERNWGETS